MIEALNVTKRFGARTVVRDFSTRILRGDRVGIIGPNGAGKTTLLAPADRPRWRRTQGRVRHGTGLSGRLCRSAPRRASISTPRPGRRSAPTGGDQVLVQGQFRHVVGYLRDFLFRPEQARTPIRALSGGERNRLLLARQLATPCNLLVLDEPTNDLDMDTLDLLQEVLAEFAGTLLLVSHDRDFLDRLVTSVIAFEGDGRLQEYAGGYSDHLRQRRPAAPPPAAARPRAPAKAGGAAGPARLASRRQRDLDRVIDEIARARGRDPGARARAVRPRPVRPRSTRVPPAERAAGRAAGCPPRRRRALVGVGGRAGPGRRLSAAGPRCMAGCELLTAAGRRARIALVHEWFDTYYGSERVAAQILACFPEADVFTLVDVMAEGAARLSRAATGSGPRSCSACPSRAAISASICR